MRKIGMDELRQKQMEIMDYVARFCDDNGLCYILIGGSMLGAARHKGYIPWDDDIDIGMPRADYDRFTELFPKLCDRPAYVFACCEKDKNWHLPFGKVMDMDTLLVQDGHDLGINIDIFPYDDVPNDPALAAREYKKRDRLKLANAMQLNPNPPSGNLLRRLAVYCVRFVLHRFPKYYFIRKISDDAKRWNGKGIDTVCEIVGESYAAPCPRHILFDTMDAPFEDRVYKIPKDYDTWLTMRFGDYMTLPPEAERKRHIFDAYVKDTEEKQ